MVGGNGKYAASIRSESKREERCTCYLIREHGRDFDRFLTIGQSRFDRFKHIDGLYQNQYKYTYLGNFDTMCQLCVLVFMKLTWF